MSDFPIECHLTAGRSALNGYHNKVREREHAILECLGALGLAISQDGGIQAMM